MTVFKLKSSAVTAVWKFSPLILFLKSQNAQGIKALRNRSGELSLMNAMIVQCSLLLVARVMESIDKMGCTGLQVTIHSFTKPEVKHLNSVSCFAHLSFKVIRIPALFDSLHQCHEIK